MKLIDLRSDTVTQPTAAMRAAMANAEVGDDVYGEDPTVNRLEAMAAALVGKPAALFVPSGVMGNTIAIKCHTQHGQEVICESRAHVLDWELSMMAWFAGCLARPVDAPLGIMTWDTIALAIKKPGPHNAPTALITIENTFNMAGGTVYPVDVIDDVCARAHSLQIPVHMDGARLFNAAVALQVPASRLVQHIDTVMFCLSKGLGAPVGSLLAGPAELIAQARSYRKRLGGGMRQAGILAAAGLIALTDGVQRLHEDHANAQHLAQSIANLPGIKIDPAHVPTNIVLFEVTHPTLSNTDIVQAWAARGIKTLTIGPNKIRAITHCDVTREDCSTAASALREIVNF